MQPENVASVADIEALYRQYGWIGAAAGVVYGLLRIWKSGLVDTWLNSAFPKLQWDARSRWAKLAIVFVLSGAAAALAGVAAGQSLVSALFAGLLAAVSAIGMHETRETVAKAVAETRGTAEVGREEQSIRTRLQGGPSDGA